MKNFVFIPFVLLGQVFCYPVTFGGKVYGGPRNNYPINACSFFDRTRMQFSGCDGLDAANMYCQARGYSKAENFRLIPVEHIGSSYVLGNEKIVEAGLGIEQHLLSDVTCV